jgi:hypothetical protein
MILLSWHIKHLSPYLVKGVETRSGHASQTGLEFAFLFLSLQSSGIIVVHH